MSTEVKVKINPVDLNAIEKIAIQGSSLGGCIVDGDFELIKVSETLADTVNEKQSALLGQPMLNLFPQTQHDEVNAAFRTLLKNTDGTYCHSLNLKTSQDKHVAVYAVHKRVDYDNQTYISSQFLHLPKELQFGDSFSDTETFQQLIIDSDIDLVYIKNTSFEVVFSNSQYKFLFPEDDAEGFAAANTDSRNHDLLAFKQGYIETRETLTLPDEQEIIVQTRRTRFTKSNGEQFIVCIAKDITDQEAVIAQLKMSNEDLGQFAYIASHDLRSPLNAIEKLITWIEDDDISALPDSSKEYLLRELITTAPRMPAHLSADEVMITWSFDT